MRYLDKVVFISKKDSYYDYDLGEHVVGTLEETELEVNVTDLGSNRSIALFGDIKENAKVIRLQPSQDALAFGYVVINDKKYKLMKDIFPRDRKTFIVKEYVDV